MDLFYSDVTQNINVTWDNLIDDLKKTTTFNPYCKSDNYYNIFRQIIVSILTNHEIILLDSDFTEAEVAKLIGPTTNGNFNHQINSEKINFPSNKEVLIKKLQNVSEDWKITLFTSGTTGTPKKVSHSFTSISRFVKKADKNKDNIWGFAYNPTHMAGVQVFFQALLNGNSIIRLFNLPAEVIYREIQKHSITHISATPTFYRLLMPCQLNFPSVVRITSGGEKFNEKTISQLVEIFPNARITNVYASTEAGTLFASENDTFMIKKEFEQLIKIDNEELLIHKSLMGTSDLIEEEWYKTGDLIEIIAESPLKFRFKSRKSDVINVGGYKVNPLEVEAVICSIPQVKDARVFAKSNSVLGNIVCCEIATENHDITEAYIRAYLQNELQEFKIPRIITFVKELSTTRTGKLKRI